MPRYFFNVFDGRDFIDHVGTDLPDWAAARTLALRHAGEVLQTDAARFPPNEDWRMEVTDEGGLVLFRLDFSVTSAPATQQLRPQLRDPA